MDTGDEGRHHEAQVMRRQALEINDSIVQGLATAVYALEHGSTRRALDAMRTTLGAARQMMSDLIASAPEEQGLSPGDLVRAEAARVISDLAPMPAVPATDSGVETIRVAIADDTADIRMLLRVTLDPSFGFEIVGEAGDGRDAIRLCEQTHPDVIVLDLAMPVLDGLQAIPEIIRVSPETKILVLSGYGAQQMAEEAMLLGAHAYLEKGETSRKVVDAVQGLCPQKNVATAEPSSLPEDEPPRAGSEAEQILAMYLRELGTPVTVFRGVIDTLMQRIDSLPSPVVREFLESMHRNVERMNSMIEAFNDAHLIDTDQLILAREPVDVGGLLRATVHSLGDMTKERAVTITASEGIVADIDRLRVRQVIVNLVSNAVKFSPEGSPIEIGLDTLEDYVVLSVTDHGTAIPPDKRNRLFEKFERLQNEGAGIGLGLYMSRAIARGHGGNLVLGRSDINRTTFVAVLPMKEKSHAHGERAAG